MASSSELERRSWGAIGRNYLNTSAFCVVIAVTLWLLGMANPLWASFVVSFCIGYSTMTASAFLLPLFLRVMPPAIAPVPTTLIGVGVGVGLSGYLILGDPWYFFVDNDYSTPLLGLFFGMLGLLFFTAQSQLQDTRAELADARAEQLDREKTHLETELKLLQAQIEPHFLFNTLSNIVSMIQEQPEAAEKTLLNLTTLLRANLQRTREPTTRLGDELLVVEALLKINQTRMGNRLSFRIEVPEALKDQPLPPMLLQPLVENAISHGIEPLESGGSITITGTADGDRLTITVADTGAGIRAGPEQRNGRSASESGIGISNVQQRLGQLFGKEASLMLSENAPQGVIATLSLPRADA